MKKVNISVVIATFNEEENIVDCIESAKKIADDVVIVDGSSNDRTRELARNLGAKVIKTTNKQMFHINKNLAINNCYGDWIFLIDADERITHELAQEIKELIAKNPKDNGFWVNRRNWFLGEFLKKGGAYPDRVIRLFRRGKGKLPEINVHEQLKINGEVGYLRKDLLHIADPMFSRYLERANRYTTQTAQEFKKEDVGRGLSKALYFMVLKPFFVFIKIYFRHKGYQDGFRGFIWALFSAIHYFYAYVKYWEIKKININSEKLLTKAQN